jgi:two-component system, NarL family, response regulator LiaR
MTSSNFNISIIEDNEELLEALNLMIQFTEGFTVCDCYKSGEEAMLKISNNLPDAILMDINLPAMSGIEALTRIKALHPQILILMCTSYEDADKIFESLQAGASGYILKTEGPSKIMASLQEMLQGGSPMSASIARKVVESFNVFNNKNTIVELLTERENLVLNFLSKGLLNKEVADKMEISVGTIRKHVQNIYKKLHVNTRVEAVNLFLKR